MLSSTFYKLGNATNILPGLFGTTPIQFKDRVAKINVKFRKRCMKSLVFVVLHSIFFAYQAWSAKKSGDLGAFNFSMLFLQAGILFCGSQVYLLLNGQQYAQMINSVTEFLEKYKRNWLPSFDPKKDFWNRMFVGLIIFSLVGLVGAVTLSAGHFCLYPQAGIYLTSIMPLEKWKLEQDLPFVYVHPAIMGFFALVYVGLFGMLYCALYFHGFCIITYVFYATPILVMDFRLRGSSNSKIRVSSDLHKPTNLVTVYRGLEVLHAITMDAYGPLIVPVQGILGQMILLSVFTLIRHWAQLETTFTMVLILWFTGCFSFWSIVLQFGGYFFKASKKTIISWRKYKGSSFESRWLGKVRKSCRPLRIGYPGYYKITNMSLFKFWQGVVRSVFRALLALK